MQPKELSELTDEQLLQEAKKIKSTTLINATLIGFLVGIIFFSIIKNTAGLFTLIPLFLAYKIANSSKYTSEELEKLLKERNLK